MDTQELLDRFCDQERIYRFEGQQGIHDLAKVVRAIGYKDPAYQLQLSHEASVGDLLIFFQDNPGALEAVYEWILGQNSEEWNQHLMDVVPPEEDEEDADTADGEEAAEGE